MHNLHQRITAGRWALAVGHRVEPLIFAGTGLGGEAEAVSVEGSQFSRDRSAGDLYARRVIDEWQRAYEQSMMIGWDFSALDGKLSADEPWWDFDQDCRSAIARAQRIVDLGTGGGERLLRLMSDEGAVHKSIGATEGWGPNLAVAREALGARGVALVSYDSERDARLPFPDESLDLVMSRHESIDAREIARVLSPGGRLLTQQVDGHDAPEIHEWFGAAFAYPHVTSRRYVDDIGAAGLHVDVVDDWRGTMEFADAETLVSYLALVPWDAPHFSIEEHAPQLIALDADRPIKVSQFRFRIYATKPQPTDIEGS